jgi:hypothetical protein
MIRRLLTISAAAAVLAGCGGRTGPAVPPAPVPLDVQHALSVANAVTGTTALVALSPNSQAHTIPLSGTFRGSISLHGHGTPVGASIDVGSQAISPSATGTACPPFPLITFKNPRPFPVVVDIDSLSFDLPCTPAQSLFGVSAYQTIPMPSVVTSKKLGDVTVTGNEFLFAPSAATITLAANSTSVLATIPERSTAEVALPVAPGSSTVLTSNAPTVPGLSLSYATASGASLYGASCFNAFDAQGNLAADLAGQQILGKPKLYCIIDPQGAPSITLGANPTFNVDFSKIDVGLLQIDGPIRTNPCATTSASGETCATSTFTIGSASDQFQKAIISNAQDIAACVPADGFSDCNAPGSTQKSSFLPLNRSSLELEVSNDPTYVLPAFGGYALTVSPASATTCSLDVGPDNPIANPDYPAGYYDPQAQAGATSTAAIYPGDAKSGSAELDINTLGTAGTCSIDIAETSGLGRHYTFSIPVHN